MSTLHETSIKELSPSLQEEWEYEFVDSPILGIDKSKAPQKLDPRAAITAKNVRFRRGRVEVDTGYTTFGQIIRGNPRATYEFFLTGGSSILTLVTNDTFYRWSATALEWQYIQDGTVGTTLTADANATDTSLTVASITGFSDGDNIGITLDDGTEHQTTINGTPAGSTITITDAMPGLASIGNAVVKAADLTGDDEHGVSITTWATPDKMYFTNGVDAPKQYDGTSVSDISNLPGTTFVCAVVIVHRGFLLLMSTIEDGTRKPQRVRWCEPDDPTDWNELVNFKDLQDTEDWIIAAGELAGDLFIYKERSIIRQQLIGQVNDTWAWDNMVISEGTPSVDGVITLGDLHLFFGNSNIYEYEGGFVLRPIGDKIYDLIFGDEGELETQQSGKIFGIYIEELDEAWFFYPKIGDTFPTKALRYRFSTESWVVREFPQEIAGYGFFSSTTVTAWQDAVGTWSEQSGPWKTKKRTVGSPTIHLTDPINDRVYDYNYTEADDNGTNISYIFETKDFYLPNREFRTNKFEFYIRGSVIKIEYSLDQGSSYTTLLTATPGAGYKKVRKFKQVVGRQIRLRFSGTASFGLSWFGFTWKPETMHT